VDRARQPVGLAHHHGGILSWASEGDARVSSLPPGLPRRDDLLDQFSKVDLFELRAVKLGVGTRGFADIVDEPVEPSNIFTSDRHQSLTKLGIVHALKALNRRPQRGKGVLEL